MTKAKVLARAASCFELAQDSRTSARFYDRAAEEVASLGSNPQLSAELSNRSAIQFRASCEYFAAGVAWARAAEQFAKIQSDFVNCSENLVPLPGSCFKSQLCGLCMEAAADAFEKASGNETRSITAYWRAGDAYSEGAPGTRAFDAYRKALTAQIRYHGTLESELLRLSLPLPHLDRTAEPRHLDVMETALVRCNNHKHGGDTPRSRLETNRQMAAACHGFILELQAAGNTKEAGRFRSQQNERQRRILASQGKYLAAGLYYLWRLASDYGESLGRWGVTCVLVILGFAATYAALGVIAFTRDSPDRSLRLFDYVYFSAITFGTLGYGDLHPIGFCGQALACLEVFAGLIMFGVLLSIIGNRFQRG
jgi:hypothetical protein